MANLNLDDGTAETLVMHAAARGISVDEFVRLLLHRANSDPGTSPRITPEEFERLIEAEATDTPGLPGDFSRADIYSDHD